MKIHTNELTLDDLFRAVPKGLVLGAQQWGSRSHARAFDVKLSALRPGTDSHGGKRRGNKATWVEWGDWICALFELDPGAKIGVYDDPEDFIAKTTEQAPKRPLYEGNTIPHVDRSKNTLRKDIAA